MAWTPQLNSLSIINLHQLADAVDDMSCLPSDMWEVVGPALTCLEADTLASLLQSVGLQSHAASLLKYHSDTDEDYDDGDHLIIKANPINYENYKVGQRP